MNKSQDKLPPPLIGVWFLPLIDFFPVMAAFGHLWKQCEPNCSYYLPCDGHGTPGPERKTETLPRVPKGKLMWEGGYMGNGTSVPISTNCHSLQDGEDGDCKRS